MDWAIGKFTTISQIVEPFGQAVYPSSSSPSSLGYLLGKGQEGKVLNPLPFSLSPFPSPDKRIFGLADY